MSKPTPNSNELHNWLQWQKYQFFPGYFTGGKIHPAIRKLSRKQAIFVIIIIFLLYLVSAVQTNI